MRLLCSRHLITTRIPASLEHCTKSLIAPSHCLCAKCFILLRRANNEQKKKIVFGKPRGKGQPRWRERAEPGMVTIGATFRRRGRDRGGGASVPTRESLTHPPPLSRGPPGSLTSSPSPYFLADVGACLPVQLTGSHGKAIARLAIDRLLLPPRAFGRLSPRSSTSGATGSLPPLTPVTKFSIWKGCAFRFSSIK